MLIAQQTGTAELLFAAAHKMGLQPSWVVPSGLFAVSVNGREEYVNFTRSSLNSAVSTSLASNKYLARMVLDRHGVRNIPFMWPRTIASAQNFLARHGKIIAKPLAGSGSQDVHIITTPFQLEGLEIDNCILEKYIAGKEVRYLVLNDSILAVHESEYGRSVAADRELRRVSYSKDIWDEYLIKESLRIARILGLRFAAIDYIVDAEKKCHLLEINSAPGLKWFHAPSSGPVVNVAESLLETLYMRRPAGITSNS